MSCGLVRHLPHPHPPSTAVVMSSAASGSADYGAVQTAYRDLATHPEVEGKLATLLSALRELRQSNPTALTTVAIENNVITNGLDSMTGEPMSKLLMGVATQYKEMVTSGATPEEKFVAAYKNRVEMMLVLCIIRRHMGLKVRTVSTEIESKAFDTSLNELTFGYDARPPVAQWFAFAYFMYGAFASKAELPKRVAEHYGKYLTQFRRKYTFSEKDVKQLLDSFPKVDEEFAEKNGLTAFRIPSGKPTASSAKKSAGSTDAAKEASAGETGGPGARYNEEEEEEEWSDLAVLANKYGSGRGQSPNVLSSAEPSPSPAPASLGDAVAAAVDVPAAAVAAAVAVPAAVAAAAAAAVAVPAAAAAAAAVAPVAAVASAVASASARKRPAEESSGASAVVSGSVRAVIDDDAATRLRDAVSRHGEALTEQLRSVREGAVTMQSCVALIDALATHVYSGDYLDSLSGVAKSLPDELDRCLLPLVNTATLCGNHVNSVSRVFHVAANDPEVTMVLTNLRDSMTTTLDDLQRRLGTFMETIRSDAQRIMEAEAEAKRLRLEQEIAQKKAAEEEEKRRRDAAAAAAAAAAAEEQRRSEAAAAADAAAAAAAPAELTMDEIQARLDEARRKLQDLTERKAAGLAKIKRPELATRLFKVLDDAMHM